MPALPSPPRRAARSPILAALVFLIRVVCGAAIVLDELVRPLYRPLVRWIAALGLMRALERWVSGLSPYLVLLLIGVPYAVVEPLKFLALLKIADGHVKTGGAAFLLAHLVSFVLIERIFTAGRAQLMTLRPVAWLVNTAASVRDAITDFIRLDRIKARLRALARWARMKLR
ncbi:hypothetical protein [Xanthobacter sp. KR7-225]|uniref:hypothetical protein n=1 Tax=Xanthobacter sp. KR7-225 TaxID=3156613 RepID=UPI0032B31B01